MRLKITMLFGIALVFSLSCVAHAEQEINFYCKNDCLVKGGTMGKCNALCSTTTESGSKTKDMNCLSSCMARSNETAYSCYSACDTSGNASGEAVGTNGQSGDATPNKALH